MRCGGRGSVGGAMGAGRIRLRERYQARRMTALFSLRLRQGFGATSRAVDFGRREFAYGEIVWS